MYQLQNIKTKHQITAHLAETMMLLNMSFLELDNVIQDELSKNPALELSKERRCPICNHILEENAPCPICSKPKTISPDEVICFISPKHDLKLPRSDSSDFLDEVKSIDRESLPLYVSPSPAPGLNKSERLIAAYLLNQLDKDGFLKINLSEVALYLHVSLSNIEKVRRIIQRADPLGVGSKNIQDALLVQVEVISEDKIIPSHTEEIIKNCFDLFVRKKYQDIFKKLKVNHEEVEEIADFVAHNLNPYPARAHWGNIHQPTLNDINVYRYPDVIISYLNNDPDNPLLVEILFPSERNLQINKFYKQSIEIADDDKKQELKKDLEKATLFIKCIQQRNNTMIRLMGNLVNKQRDFIKKGKKYLKPITRADISRELKVHESTISRAVANKSVQLPNGHIIPISMFFERNLCIRETIKEIVTEEINPLSDAKIASRLKKLGFNIARRTVAKYRAMEGILPAHMRNKNNEMINNQ